jgi:nuclear pore complex protein Nup93
MIGGTPLWAKIFYLVRSGHIQEALQVVTDSENAINQRERSFVTFFKAWAESADRRYYHLYPQHLTVNSIVVIAFRQISGSV